MKAGAKKKLEVEKKKDDDEIVICESEPLPMTKRALAERKMVRGLKFKQFDPITDLDQCRNFAATITAKRRTGKSVLLKDMCSKFHKAKWYSNVYVFSLTAHLQKDLFDYVPKENIFYGLDEKKLGELWEAKQYFVTNELKAGKEVKDIPLDLIIGDDLIGDSKACRGSKMLNNLYVAGRHLGFAVIFLTQYFCAIPPTIRSNTDFAICFMLKAVNDRESFAEAYLSSYNKNIGLEILRRCTVDAGYQAMIVMNNVHQEDPQEYVRVYTAELKVPKFKMLSVPPVGVNWHHQVSSEGMSNIRFIEPIRRGKNGR